MSCWYKQTRKKMRDLCKGEHAGAEGEAPEGGANYSMAVFINARHKRAKHILQMALAGSFATTERSGRSVFVVSTYIVQGVALAGEQTGGAQAEPSAWVI